VRREIFFVEFLFFWTSELHMSQAFRNTKHIKFLLHGDEPLLNFYSKWIVARHINML
jgi:ABC-type tungstate transport system permease subunit